MDFTDLYSTGTSIINLGLYVLFPALICVGTSVLFINTRAKRIFKVFITAALLMIILSSTMIIIGICAHIEGQSDYVASIKEKSAKYDTIYFNDIKTDADSINWDGLSKSNHVSYKTDDEKKIMWISSKTRRGSRSSSEKYIFTDDIKADSSIEINETDVNPILQKISEGYEVYINGIKVNIEEASKVDYDHVSYSVDNEKKIIIVTTR